MTFHHVVRDPRVPTPAPPLLVLLHGIGADEEDLLPLADHLEPSLRTVSLRAPHEAQPMGYAWYAIDWYTHPPRADVSEARASRDALAVYLEAAPRVHGTDPARTFLLGFSQGAVMALAVALARPELVRGAILHSGRALPGLVDRVPDAARLASLEVLVLHGVEDDVIPVERGREIRDLLAPALGSRVEYREHDAGHELTGATVADVARWIGARV